MTSIALFELNKDIIFKDNKPDEIIISGEYMGEFEGVIENDETLPVEISSLVYGVSKKKSAQLPLKNLIEKAIASEEVYDFNKYVSEQPEFFVILDEVTGGMDPAHLDNAINHISTISRESVTGNNLKLLDRIWTRLKSIYLMRTHNETSFRDEVQILMNNCSKQDEKENIAKKFLGLFTSEKNKHNGKEWFSVYHGFNTYTIENCINVQLPEKVLKASDFFDYLLSAQDVYKNYPIYCDNSEVNAAAASRMTDGIDITEIINLLKMDERYNFSELFSAAKNLIENETATNENIKPALNLCKVLSYEPLKLNVSLRYLETLSHENGISYDLQMLRALAGKEISGENDSYYAEMAKIVYCYTDTYDIWNKTHNYRTQVMAKVLECLIKKNQHLGNPDGVKDILTEIANIDKLTGVEHQLVIRFLNDWGKITLNDTEKKIALQNVFGDETWCKALLEEDCPLSRAILDKFYQDFNAQAITAFVNLKNAWVATNTSYWLRVLKVLVDSDEFKRVCSVKIVEITTHVIEGICTGQITDGNENMDLQLKLLSWTKFDKVSSKVNDMMSKFSGQLYINVFMFKSLHHYFEKTRGLETQFLNYVLKPIIEDVEVQRIIYTMKDFYEPLLQCNIDQASDLKVEIAKVYNSSNNEGFKALVERLGILPKDETQ